MRSNNKGFTLVELIVAISILGIIMLLAIPQLMGLRDDNKDTKYEKYSDSIVASAKLYTDSYSIDMFGHNSSGCYDISFKKLEEKNLAKDIQVDDLTCDTYNETIPTTFVRVYKSQDNYLYDIAIKCVDKNGRVAYEKILNGDICDGKTTDVTGPTIEISGIVNGWTTGKDGSGNPLKATVTIKDSYGLKENVSVKYAWTKNLSNIDALTYETKSFDNSRQDVKTELSFTVTYPQNENGLWYLIVKPGENGLRDLNGNYFNEDNIQGGPVKLDNTAPVITNISNSKDGVWINQDVTVSGTISDAHSGVNKIYYSYSSTGASPKAFGTSQITSGGVGPFDVSNTWTSDTNESVYLIGEDSVGNKSVISSAGKVMVDKTRPSIEWILRPGVHNNNNGISVTSRCTDTLSGVNTSSSATAVSAPTATSGENVTHSCTDNAGNLASISGNYKVRVKGRDLSCGVEEYKECRDPECDVEQYNSCTHEDCGKGCPSGYSINSAKTLCSKTSYTNSTVTCNGGRELYSGRCYVVMSRSACESSCGGGSGSCLAWGGSTALCMSGGTVPVNSCPSGYSPSGSTCVKTSTSYPTTNTCRTEACGIESYKLCRHSNCGVELYEECWHY